MSRAVCPSRPERGVHEDRGAALILAMVFVVVVGVISAGLMGLVTSSLRNRTPLEAQRNRQYAADGAVEYAIARVRLASVPVGPGLDSPLPPLTACNQPGSSMAPDGLATGMPVLNGVPIRVDWKNVCAAVRGSDGLVVVQRNVIFAACVALPAASACVANAVIVRAQVNFEQNATDAVTMTYVQTWSVNG